MWRVSLGIFLCVITSGSGNGIQNKTGHCEHNKVGSQKEYVTCKFYNAIPRDVKRPERVEFLSMNSGTNVLSTLHTNTLLDLKMIELKELDLSSCHVEIIERGAFNTTNNVEKLNLSDNMIEHLDAEVFFGLNSLLELDLKRNPIKAFAEGIAGFPFLPELRKLDMSLCRLSIIPETAFVMLDRLQSISLENNHLWGLSWRTFEKNINLQEIKLSGNNWKCDCNTRFLMVYLEAHHPYLSGHYKIGSRCDRFNNRSWGSSFSKMDCLPFIESLTPLISARVPLLNHNDESEMRYGDGLIIKCYYSGYPTPSVSWEKDSNVVSDNGTDPRIRIQDDTLEIIRNLKSTDIDFNYRHLFVLRISDIKAEDAGVYSCVLKNEKGLVVSEKSCALIPIPSNETLIVKEDYQKPTPLLPIWLLITLIICVLSFILIIIIIILYMKYFKVTLRKTPNDKREPSIISEDRFMYIPKDSESVDEMPQIFTFPRSNKKKATSQDFTMHTFGRNCTRNLPVEVATD